MRFSGSPVVVRMKSDGPTRPDNPGFANIYRVTAVRISYPVLCNIPVTNYSILIIQHQLSCPLLWLSILYNPTANCRSPAVESLSRHPLSLSLSLSLYHDHLSSLLSSILLHPLVSVLLYSLLSTLLSCLLLAVDVSVSIPLPSASTRLLPLLYSSPFPLPSDVPPPG